MPLNPLPLAGADEPEWSDDDEFDDELELSLPDLSHDSKHNSPSRGPIFAARENVTACPPAAASAAPYTAAPAPAPTRPAGRDAAAPPAAAAAASGGEGSRRPHERRAGRQLDDSIDFDEFLADESMGASMDYSSASISGIDSPEKPPPATRLPPASSAPPPPPRAPPPPALAPPGKIPTEAPRAPPLLPLPSPAAAPAAAASLPPRPISAPPAATPSMSDAMSAARAATERALANTATGRADGAAPPVRRVLSITRRDSTGRILSKEIPSMVAPPAAAARGGEDRAAAAAAAGVKVEEGSAMSVEGARLQAVTPKAEVGRWKDEGDAHEAEIAGQKEDARVLSGQAINVGRTVGADVQVENVGQKAEAVVQEEANVGRNVATHVHKEESVDRKAEADVRQEGTLGREAEADVHKAECVGRSIEADVHKDENVGRPAEADARKVEGAGIETEGGARKAESVAREAQADIQKEERDARELVPAAGNVSSKAVSQESVLPSAPPAAPKSSFFPHFGDSSRGIVLRRAAHILPRSLAHVCVGDLFNSDEEEEEATPAAPPPAGRASHEARPTSLPSLAEEPSAPPSASTSSARDSADEASRQGSEGVARSDGGDDESSEAGSESSRQRSEGGERRGGDDDESSRGGSESSSRAATPPRGSGAVGSFLLRAAGAQFLTVDDIESEPSASPRSAAHERDDTGTDVADTRLAQAHGATAESTVLALYEEPAATLASCQAMVLAHAAVPASSAGDVHEERMNLPRHREASQMLPMPPSNKKDARSPKAKMLPVPPSNKPDTRSSTAKLWPVPEGKHRVGPPSSFNHRLSRRNVPDASALAEQELEERLTLLVMSMLVQ